MYQFGIRLPVTADDKGLAQLVGYRFQMGGVTPEIWLGLPLSSDYGDAVDFILSIGVGFGMP